MPELWNLVWGKPEIDPLALADAIEASAESDDLDYRTCLLIRDAAAALECRWGPVRMRQWLERIRSCSRIESIRRHLQDPHGFPSLQERLMESSKPETIHQYLRDLGNRIHRSARIAVGGAGALILHGTLSRSTKDIAVVEEVPAEVRSQHAELEELQGRYALRLAHFQSHFLPTGWEKRLHSLGSFGALEVFLVDPSDVFLSKLFSARHKDLDDLRLLLPTIDRQILARRLGDSCIGLLGELALRQNAERNWYVLTGEPLPLGPA
jgi:hypothetical protein